MSSASRASLLKDLRTHRFWLRFLTQFFAGLGLLSAIVGITDALFPGVLPPRGWVLLAALTLGSAGWAAWRSWPRPIQQTYQQPKTEIRVVIGDLFAQDGNVVVGMSTTFDTETPHVISATSVQGQLLSQVYSGDIRALDTHLSAALASTPPCGSFSASDHKRGKQHIYPIGTVAVISQAPRKLYFCVAYTEMQANCTVQADVDGVWRSLNELWRVADLRGNGDPISIGVVGGGQARLSQRLPLQDAIRLTALSFMFASRGRPVSQKLNIVVQERNLDDLDSLELQAFLRSLSPS